MIRCIEYTMFITFPTTITANLFNFDYAHVYIAIFDFTSPVLCKLCKLHFKAKFRKWRDKRVQYADEKMQDPTKRPNKFNKTKTSIICIQLYFIIQFHCIL